MQGVGRIRENGNILVLTLDKTRQLGRLGHIKEDSFKLDLREIGYENVDWIHLAMDKVLWWVLENTVMKLLVS